ncbi:uncharacterized protein LOC116776234 isoform X3 [Danaus plexippus]|uniref:uncharacterized protein LOC116776234 isoform X3 n=1 Tax=Danaus plexippus TaxID=13037 RepID=UPI002AAFA63D|nr:uncharacterized protein LOC116776234 isoform X3 [Danaus plexippus]
MSLAEVRSARSSPTPESCQCDAIDASASVTSDIHKYQVACTCKPGSVQYASADEPGPPPPVKTDTPPALPPRPTTTLAANRRNNSAVGCTSEPQCRRRKYAWWCCGCGALAAALGGLLAAQHILLRAYTASPHHLETVPAAVPAAMLVLTGVCIMSLARRRNRYSYMVRKIKVVGACCLVCALTCVLVTITTTVIHMNKLQTLKFCEYTKLTRTCTCFSMSPDSHTNDDDGVRCVFEGVSDCGVVHGALYWCLRGVFALSVSAVLVCIFSCMLAYQLLSHERKKMYWEQLELRCRSLYRAPTTGRASGQQDRSQNTCSCCTQCHTTQPAWDFSVQHRFWAPGRIGNLYSPNPGTGRKTSPWSWFPWPRGNSQNSRCMNVPQSGDSAYGFCETEASPNPAQPYDERSYPQNQFHRQTPAFNQATAAFNQNPSTFNQNPANFGQGSSFQGYAEGFEGSLDGQTGVWGPPPPYSPHGRSGSRHHLHQDPASATLLHHHHMDHRNSMNVHEMHACSRNYLHNMQSIDVNRIQDVNTDIRNPELARMNPELARMNPELARMNPELARINPDMARMNPELARMNSELARINPELTRMNPELARLNPELARLNPELARLNPELARLNPDMNMYPNDPNDMCLQEMVNVGQERFNTIRGHLVPYRNCPRMGNGSGNMHRDTVDIECLHQKSVSRVSDQSSDSCPKQGKENLGFQNDKHSPIRSSLQENRQAESEVYFADVSSCCTAECCINPNVSLVGTIDNHQESSESDGSFTLTRQRPNTQGSKRRRHTDKQKHRADFSIEHAPIRECVDRGDRLNDRLDRNERVGQIERVNDSRDRLNDSRSDRMSDRLNDSRIERMSMRNDPRLERCDRDRSNDSRIDRLNDSRIDRLNDSRIERMSDRVSESRFDRSDRERSSDVRIDRMNDSRVISDRGNDSRLDRSDQDRSNDSRIDRSNDSRIDRLNDSRIDRMSDRGNDSRHERERSNDPRIDRFNDSRIERISDRANDSRLDRERSNDSRTDRFDDRRMSDINSSIRIEGSPKMRSHMSPLRMRSPKGIQKDTMEAKEFFTPISPLSPNTEESLLSDDDRQETVYSNEPEVKCLAPDSQYEAIRDGNEMLKTNHHHCYSDTNTMDSGWQSGSEKQVTD